MDNSGIEKKKGKKKKKSYTRAQIHERSEIGERIYHRLRSHYKDQNTKRALWNTRPDSIESLTRGSVN